MSIIKKTAFILAFIALPASALLAQRMSMASQKLSIAEMAIKSLYVDEVDENKLAEEAIKKMLSELDPHSTYSTPEEVKKLTEPLQGNFEGIGVQFNMVEDTLFVVQPVSGGPSEKVGILAGDRIVSVNDTAIAGVKISSDEIMSKLRGAKGTKVKVEIVRRGVNELLSFTITRGEIPIYSLDASYIIRKGIGYIRINRFSATTAAEFNEAMRKLEKQGMKSLILDLQGNGGGYLNAAIDLSNEFLGRGELIVYTEGRNNPRMDFSAKGNGHFKEGNLIVLIDEFSASASEIVAGAIQDWDRGIIVGRRSFGKGLVQRSVNLPDHSMIRLTVARYYTPAGRCIQKPYESVEAYNRDLIDRYNKGEMSNADSIHFADSLRHTTKKLARTVYGGGGIMPDYFVPVDTTLFTNYHRNLRNKGLIVQTNMKVMDSHRKEWSKTYKNFDDFDKKFEVSTATLNMLVKAANEAGIEYNEEEFRQSHPLLKLQLKALAARDLFGMSEYFQVINQANESIDKALELLDRKDFDSLLVKNAVAQ